MRSPIEVVTVQVIFIFIMPYAKVITSDEIISSDEIPKGEVDFVSEWSPWSPCSRTCGTGISFRGRRCNRDRSPCTQYPRQHRTCNNEPCPIGASSFRDQQCSKNDAYQLKFNGTDAKWKSLRRGSTRCLLYCYPVGQRVTYYFGRARDGTKCSDFPHSVCVFGKCTPVGCDRKLGTDRKFDQCQVCGGDGSSCEPFASSINRDVTAEENKTGYSELFTIPKRATTVLISEGTASFIAIKSRSGEWLMNGDHVVTKPGSQRTDGVDVRYTRLPDNKTEAVMILGPTTQELYVMGLIVNSTSPKVEYEYWLPKDRPPTTIAPITEPVEPVTEDLKPVTEPVEPVTEDLKPVTEPDEPVTEDVKPVTEPIEPVTEDLKPVTEPVEPVTEELVTEIAGPFTKPISLATEFLKPSTELFGQLTESVKPFTSGVRVTKAVNWEDAGPITQRVQYTGKTTGILQSVTTSQPKYNVNSSIALVTRSTFLSLKSISAEHSIASQSAQVTATRKTPSITTKAHSIATPTVLVSSPETVRPEVMKTSAFYSNESRVLPSITALPSFKGSAKSRTEKRRNSSKVLPSLVLYSLSTSNVSVDRSLSQAVTPTSRLLRTVTNIPSDGQSKIGETSTSYVSSLTSEVDSSDHTIKVSSSKTEDKGYSVRTVGTTLPIVKSGATLSTPSNYESVTASQKVLYTMSAVRSKSSESGGKTKQTPSSVNASTSISTGSKLGMASVQGKQSTSLPMLPSVSTLTFGDSVTETASSRLPTKLGVVASRAEASTKEIKQQRSSIVTSISPTRTTEKLETMPSSTKGTQGLLHTTELPTSKAESGTAATSTDERTTTLKPVFPTTEFMPWGAWTACSTSCGGGFRVRARTCLRRPDGLCLSDETQVKPCNTLPCRLVDKTWSTWGPWAGCTVSCGGGARVRFRICQSATKTRVRSGCPGRSYEVRSCNTDICASRSRVEPSSSKKQTLLSSSMSSSLRTSSSPPQPSSSSSSSAAAASLRTFTVSPLLFSSPSSSSLSAKVSVMQSSSPVTVAPSMRTSSTPLLSSSNIQKFTTETISNNRKTLNLILTSTPSLTSTVILSVLHSYASVHSSQSQIYVSPSSQYIEISSAKINELTSTKRQVTTRMETVTKEATATIDPSTTPKEDATYVAIAKNTNATNNPTTENTTITTSEPTTMEAITTTKPLTEDNSSTTTIPITTETTNTVMLTTKKATITAKPTATEAIITPGPTTTGAVTPTQVTITAVKNTVKPIPMEATTAGPTTTEAIITDKPTTTEATAISIPTPFDATTTGKLTTTEETTTTQPSTSEATTASITPTTEVNITLNPTTTEETATVKPTTKQATTNADPTTNEATTSAKPTTTEATTTTTATPTTTETTTTTKPTTTEATSTAKPTTTEATTTAKPTTTEATTTAKSTTNEATTSAKPTTTEAATTATPTTTETTTTTKPTTTEATSTAKPTTTEATTTAKPTTTEATSTAKPTTTEATSTAKPTTTEATSTAKPTTMEATTTAKPTTTEATTTVKPTTMEATTTAKPTTMEATSTTKPTTMEATTTAKPTTMEATSTTKPTTTEATSTVKPTTTKATTSAKPTTTEATTTAKPTTTETTTTTKPTTAEATTTAKPTTTEATTTTKPTNAESTTTAKPTTMEATTTAKPTTTEATTTAKPTTTEATSTAKPTTTEATSTAKPTTTEATTTAKPTTTEATSTAKPTTTEATSTAKPTTTEATSTAKSTTTEATTTAKPTTTEATSTAKPTTTEATSTAKPTTTEATTKAKPTTTDENTTTKPATTEATTTAKPTTTEATTSAKPTTTDENTTTKPATTEATTTAKPTTTEATTSAKPTTTEATTVKLTTTEATTTAKPTTTDENTTTKPATTGATASTKPTTTEATTTATPTTTEATTTTKPVTTTSAPCAPCNLNQRTLERGYCTSDVVIHTVITSPMRVTHSRAVYEASILSVYKASELLPRTVFIRVPGGRCPCPHLLPGKDYVIMGKIARNKKGEVRVTLSQRSFAKRWDIPIELGLGRNKPDCTKIERRPKTTVAPTTTNQPTTAPATLLVTTPSSTTEKPITESPATCPPCLASRHKNKAYCSNDHVVRVEIGKEHVTAQDKKAFRAFVKTIYKGPLDLSEIIIRVSGSKCSCPDFKVGQDYIIMGSARFGKRGVYRLVMNKDSLAEEWYYAFNNEVSALRQCDLPATTVPVAMTTVTSAPVTLTPKCGACRESENPGAHFCISQHATVHRSREHSISTGFPWTI
ncbi:mucin-17 isoform X2 [Nematostella vectensis]|uniref:mucin-17 isoform X2 n=1 Tax=Nematostella vectensis TaxID=45351 RepID=UPI002077764F|nr:mucin-17 isoform X2 [Nematostella vectensis]